MPATLTLMPKPNALMSSPDQESRGVSNEVVLHDPENPRSVTSLVPQKIRTVIEEALYSHPHYFNKPDVELRDLIEPSRTADRVRVAFWHEYNSAMDHGKSMQMSKVYGPLMHHKTFYNEFLGKPENVAWMLAPPSEFMLVMEAALIDGADELSRLMKCRIVDEKGNIKVKEAKIFLQAFELLSDRVRGAVVQRVEQKTANLHVHKAGESLPSEGNTDELRAQLEALRKTSRLTTTLETRDVNDADEA